MLLTGGPPTGTRRGAGLGRPFWQFFLVTLFFDLGFGLYFFLVNLYLSQMHFSEKTIGLTAGALTLGNVLATLPTGVMARRVGLGRVLLVGFLAAPLFAGLRIATSNAGLQIALAFLQGAAMCTYTVCFPPALARLTSEERRTSAFSITFGTGIGCGAVAGLAGGWIPEWLQRTTGAASNVPGMRAVLLGACVIVLLGIPPLLRVDLQEPQMTTGVREGLRRSTGFLIPFLIGIAIWNFGSGSFAPFASIYLSTTMHVSLPHIGLIFSASQLLQVLGVSAAPLLYSWLGKEKGIGCLQLAAAASLVLLARAHQVPFAIAAYLMLMCFQYTCSPGLYSLAMDRATPELQPSVSAAQNITSCISLACTAALAGVVIVRFGYAALLTGAGAIAAMAALIFLFLRGPGRKASERLEMGVAQAESFSNEAALSQ